MILEILETSVSEVVEGEGDLYEQGAARQERADIIAQNIHVLIDDYRL